MRKLRGGSNLTWKGKGRVLSHYTTAGFAGIIAYNRVQRTFGRIVGFKDVEAPVEIEEEIAQLDGRESVTAGVIVGK
jgi:hypothetical protein